MFQRVSATDRAENTGASAALRLESSRSAPASLASPRTSPTR